MMQAWSDYLDGLRVVAIKRDRGVAQLSKSAAEPLLKPSGTSLCADSHD